MFKILLIFIFGAIAGGAAVKILDSRLHGNDKAEKPESLLKKQAREKDENKQSILGILETQSPLTNNHVEQLLGISDATATRYLEELEKEGKVRQVGETGRHVYYERI